MRGRFVQLGGMKHVFMRIRYDSAPGWHICIIHSPAKNIGAILRHRTILFAIVLHVNSIMRVSGTTLCVWRSSLHTTKYPRALHKNAVANRTFKQISTCNCKLPVTRISLKSCKWKSRTIASTKSLRVFASLRVLEQAVSYRTNFDGNLPFIIWRI